MIHTRCHLSSPAAAPAEGCPHEPGDRETDAAGRRRGPLRLLPGELRETQLAALDERFQERKDRIKLLGHRAREAGIAEIRRREDMVPLLFPHTVYKSYPESFLIEEQWDRLGKWLGTVSPTRSARSRPSDITGIDDWIERLAAKGHYVSCSSGTTGKSAMLLASERGHGLVAQGHGQCLFLGLGRAAGPGPADDRPCAHRSVPKNLVIGEAQQAAFGDPAKERFRLPIPPITVGSLTKMVVLRKKIADGTALPEELAEFEQTSRERQEALEAAMIAGAEALIRYRDEKLYISGLWNALYQVAKIVRDMGYSPRIFTPTTASMSAAGSSAPSCHRTIRNSSTRRSTSRPAGTSRTTPCRSSIPACPSASRAAGITCRRGWCPSSWTRKARRCCRTRPARSRVAPPSSISRSTGAGAESSPATRSPSISVPAPVAAKSPSVRNNIVRYADIQGDDKIGCAGTVDAYVRGLA